MTHQSPEATATELQKRFAIDQHSIQAGEFAERYRDLREDAYGSCFAYSRRRLDVQLERFLPQRGAGVSILDVGCGTGHHMASLGRRGFKVAGLDGSPEMLEHARINNPGAEIHLADAEAIPFPDATFDFVLCVEVLRYLPDPAACVKEMARVLKPGGVCLATATPVFNLNGYWLVNRVARAVKVSNLVRLKQFFTTSSRLRREFAEAGFQDTAAHGVYLGPINWVERLLPSALPRVLKSWERADAALADRPILRELSNMFLVHAVRGGHDKL